MNWFAALIPVIVLGTAPVDAVPPPGQQVAANCEAPTYASHMLTCADTELRALDARMREVWAAVDFSGVVAQDAWVEAQDAWFRRRSLCAFSERHADCLQSAYAERLAVLTVLSRVAPRQPYREKEASCTGAPWGQTPVRVRAPESGALAIEDAGAQVLAAATPAQPDGTWLPYVGLELDGAVIRLAMLDGPTVDCTLIAPL